MNFTQCILLFIDWTKNEAVLYDITSKKQEKQQKNCLFEAEVTDDVRAPQHGDKTIKSAKRGY